MLRDVKRQKPNLALPDLDDIDLIGAGYRNVHDLEGSIFEWANLGYPVYRGASPATKVHPYDKKWGALLDASCRASVPDAK